MSLLISPLNDRWVLDHLRVSMAVLVAERRGAIVRLVQERGAVNVPDLSQRFSTSSSTIRRDLEWLASQGELRRTHGGAVAVESHLGAVEGTDNV